MPPCNEIFSFFVTILSRKLTGPFGVELKTVQLAYTETAWILAQMLYLKYGWLLAPNLKDWGVTCAWEPHPQIPGHSWEEPGWHLVNPLKGKAQWLSPGLDKHSSACIPFPWWRPTGRGGEALVRTWLISSLLACAWPVRGRSSPLLLCLEPRPTHLEWGKQ